VAALVTLLAVAWGQAWGGGVAWAGEPAPPVAPTTKQAQVHYDRAIVAYNLARFDEAIAGFSRAYELDPAPILLFNLAQSHWKKGDDREALFFYRRYLEAEPATTLRPRVEARIGELAAKQPAPPTPLPAARPETSPRAAAAVPATALAAAPERPALYRRPWFWGVVGALAVAGVVTALSLRSGDRPFTCPDCPTRELQ
jgi:tetratricopeptide (TPR) repeat protein